MPGISTSRNMTSGTSSSRARLAAMPSGASATMSRSGHNAESVARSSLRSSGSSSAMTARGLLMGNLEDDLHVLRACSRDGQRRESAVDILEALRDLGHLLGAL